MESRAHSPGDRDRGRDGGWDREGRKTPPHMHNPLCAPEPPTPSPGRRESVLYSSARYLLETKRKYLSSGRSPDDGDDRGRSVGSTPTGGSPVTPPTACAGTPFFCETDSPDSTRDQRPFPAAPSAARASSPPAAGSSPHLSLWRPVPSPSAVEAAPTTPPSPESPVSQQDVAESSAKAPQRVITVVLDSKTRQVGPFVPICADLYPKPTPHPPPPTPRPTFVVQEYAVCALTRVCVRGSTASDVENIAALVSGSGGTLARRARAGHLL